MNEITRHTDLVAQEAMSKVIVVGTVLFMAIALVVACILPYMTF